MRVCQPPWRMKAWSSAMRRAAPRIRPQASSAVSSLPPPGPPVPHTVTPRSFSAAISNEALRMPVVISSFSLGSRSSTDFGKGVRAHHRARIGEGMALDGDLDSAASHRGPIRHVERYALVIVEDAEPHRRLLVFGSLRRHCLLQICGELVEELVGRQPGVIGAN